MLSLAGIILWSGPCRLPRLTSWNIYGWNVPQNFFFWKSWKLYVPWNETLKSSTHKNSIPFMGTFTKLFCTLCREIWLFWCTISRIFQAYSNRQYFTSKWVYFSHRSGQKFKLKRWNHRRIKIQLPFMGTFTKLFCTLCREIWLFWCTISRIFQAYSNRQYFTSK